MEIQEEMALTKLRVAWQALAEARTLDELMPLIHGAEALRYAVKQAGMGLEMQNDVAEFKIEAECRAGEELAEMGFGQHGGDRKSRDTMSLDEIDVKRHQSKCWLLQKSVPKEKRLRYYATMRAKLKEITSVAIRRLAQKPHVSRNTGENEWYTPVEYIRAARKVMGNIDLDPASTDRANTVVQATKYYTPEDDGLSKEWRGKVWMNPPYAQPLVSQFIAKLVEHVQSGDVPEAIILINNATETSWFAALIEVARTVCFPRGRVKFWHPDGKIAAPLQGQAIIYIGDNIDDFITEFAGFGWIARIVSATS